jgi:formyl-CoA transferase
MRAVGRADLLGDPAYDTPAARLAHLQEIFDIVERWTLTRTKWEAFRELNAIGVPCGPVMDTKELLEDEDLKAGGIIVEVEHPVRGTFKTVGCPFTLSDSQVEIRRPPLLGEHNAEILHDLLDLPEDDDVERLVAADEA